MIKHLLFVFIALTAQACTASSLEVVPGTRVRIEAPSGFETAQDFSGLINKDEISSLMIHEVPTSPENLASGFEKEKLASRGLILIGHTQGTISGKKAELFQVKQYYGTTPFLKWVAIFGVEQSAVMLMASFPEAIAATTGEKLRRAILAASWDPSLGVGLFQGLGFELTGSGTLQPQQRIGNVVLIGRNGEFGTPGSSKPVMIAGTAPATHISPSNAFIESKHFVLQSNRLLDVKFLQERKIKVAGMDAYEIEGVATNKSDGVQIAFYQALIPREGLHNHR